MKKLIALGTFLALAGSAVAADLPAKAPSKGIFTYPGYDGSGFYWGVNAEAGVAQSKVDGVNTFTGSLINGTLNAAGGNIGVTAGWMKGNGSTWVAIEASGEYQNITASTDNITVSSRWSAEQIVKFGGFTQPLAWITNLTGFSFPALPNIPTPPGFNLAANTSHPYIGAGVREFGLTADFVGISNRTWELAPMIEAGVLNQLLDAKGNVSGAVLDVGAKAIFANKGLTFDLQNGVGPSAKMGTQYFGYVKVLF